jgi:hypothetical protein
MSRCFSKIQLKYCLLFLALLSAIFAINAASEVPQPPSINGLAPYGKVLSIEHGGGYNFIEVQLTSFENIVLASPILPSNIDVGATIVWENTHLAKNYYSHALERTLTQLHMVTFKQDHVEAGIIESIQTVGTKMYLAVNNHQKQLMLLLNNNQNKPEFLQGAQIEWQRADSQSYLVKSNPHNESPLAVGWVRIALISQ